MKAVFFELPSIDQDNQRQLEQAVSGVCQRGSHLSKEELYLALSSRGRPGIMLVLDARRLSVERAAIKAVLLASGLEFVEHFFRTWPKSAEAVESDESSCCQPMLQQAGQASSYSEIPGLGEVSSDQFLGGSGLGKDGSPVTEVSSGQCSGAGVLYWRLGPWARVRTQWLHSQVLDYATMQALLELDKAQLALQQASRVAEVLEIPELSEYGELGKLELSQLSDCLDDLYANAHMALGTAKAYQPGQTELLEIAGWVHYNTGNLARARRNFADAAAGDRCCLGAWLGLLTVDLDNGAAGQVQKHLAKVLESSPLEWLPWLALQRIRKSYTQLSPSQRLAFCRPRPLDTLVGVN